MRRATVITNPNASRAAGRGLAPALQVLREGGLAVEVRRTAAPGHAGQLAREALADGAELLIANGGDGTIMEVAAVTQGTGRSLGLLPAGTGNRLADNLGIRRDPEEAARIILAGQPRTIDLGRFTNAEGARYFAVAAGCGFDAEMMHRTTSRSKRILGVAAYVATGVSVSASLPRAEVRVEADAEVFEGRAVSVLVANCGRIVPFGPPVAPHVLLDDGWFDVIILDAASLPGATRVALRLLRGRLHDDPGIRLLRARRVAVTATPDFAAQADGESAGRTPFAAELLPGALTVLAPPAP
jgi:diacylglycerol kinase (ATP)